MNNIYDDSADAIESEEVRPEMVNGALVFNDGNDVVVDFSPRRQELKESNHNDNLADGHIDDVELSQIGHSLLDAISDDDDSRSEWKQTLADTIDLLKGKYEQTSWPFQNASKITSPVLMQITQHTVSNIMAEMFPANGPARMEIPGDSTEESEASSNRVDKFMNFYFTDELREYYPDKEQAMTWCVVSGSVFNKVYLDPVSKRPASHYINPQDMIVNHSTRSQFSPSRMTEVIKLSDKELRQRQNSGFYRDVQLFASDSSTMDSSIDESLDSLQGVSQGDSEYNKFYELYECHVDLDIPGFEDIGEDGEPTGIPLPYIVTIDSMSQKVLSVYRNWDEEDHLKKQIKYFVHYYYLPSFGYYGFGLAHVASGAAKAATILTRQIMDACTLSSFPGGYRVKGMRISQNDLPIGPLEFREMETGGMSIQDCLMPLPFKDPSPIMMDLKNSIEDSMLKLAAAADTPFPDFNPNAPVGTTLALMEQANRVQSGIMRRIHRSLTDELRLVYDLFAKNLPESPYPYHVEGNSVELIQSDFSQGFNILPVSDPNVISRQQRLLQAETVRNFAKESPDLFDMREVMVRILREMGVQGVDKILPNKKTEDSSTVPLDPITENKNVLIGLALKAGVSQDHQAHITVHQSLIDSQPPADQSQPTFNVDALKAHIAEHTAMKYGIDMQQQIGFVMPEDPSQLPLELQNEIAVAAASAIASQQQQQAQEAAQNQPIDPGQVMLEDIKVKQLGIEAKAHEAQTKAEIEIFKAQTRAEIDKIKLEADLKAQQSDLELRMQELELKVRDLNIRERKAAQEELHANAMEGGEIPLDNQQEVINV